VVTVRPAILHVLLGAGYLPVISPVSRNLSSTLGPALNVNGDDAAALTAIALEATELVMLSDVPGVLLDGVLIDSLTDDDARALTADGIAKDGMAAKLEAAVVALEGGVSRVRICDLAGVADVNRGTTLTLIPQPVRRSAHALVRQNISTADMTLGAVA